MHFVPMLIVASLPSVAPAPEVSLDIVSVAPASVYRLTDGLAPAHAVDSAPAVPQSPPKERGLYLRVSGGFVTTQPSNSPDEDIDFDEGWMVSVGLGQRFGAAERRTAFGLELEGFYSDQDAKDEGIIHAVDSLMVIGVMLNGIVDFKLLERLDLYGGAGIGTAWLDPDTQGGFEEEDGPFLSWQLKAGLAWRFGVATALHFGYRFLNVDDAEIDDNIGSASFDLETQQHMLEAGLIFAF